MLSALHAWSVFHMLLAAAVAVGASWALRRRDVSSDARAAAGALRVFWAGLGGTAIVQIAMLLGAASGVGAAFALVTELLAYGASAVALGALAAYFAYVFTGSRTAFLGVVALYVGVLALGSWNTFRAEPTGIALTRWLFDVTYATEPGGLLAAAPALAALLPAIGGSIAFLVLGLRSSGATRQRGILVGTALVIWFGSALVVSTGANESDTAQVVRKVASMAGFLAIYVAYLPPRLLQERWGLVGLGHEREPVNRHVAPGRTEAAGGRSFQERVSELV